MSRISHVAYADESNWNNGRFRAISIVTGQYQDTIQLSKDLGLILTEFGKSEFKWRKIAVSEGKVLIDFFFDNYSKMRVDVLVWDIKDSRHKNRIGLDDRADFSRMYYHLVNCVFAFRWPQGAQWAVYPDEHKEVDWLGLCNCLDAKARRTIATPYLDKKWHNTLQQKYSIALFRPGKSHEHPLIQIADIFAGLACYSYINFDKYREWIRMNGNNMMLSMDCDWHSANRAISNTDEGRIQILEYLNQNLKSYKCQTSLRSTHGLKTNNPKQNVNIWLYEPQHIRDRAPKK